MHSVSTVDGKVPADERARLAAMHGDAEADRIIAETEARFAPSANEGTPLLPRARRTKPAGDVIAETPTSETEE